MGKNEAKSYIEALIYISSADGEITEAEKEYFVEKGHELGLAAEEIDDICSEIANDCICLGEILEKVESDETKTELIKTLVDLCHADGKYSADEKNGMAEICSMLGLDSKILRKIEIERIAKEGKDVIKKGFSALKSGLSFAGEKSVEGSKAVASGIAAGVGKASSKVSDAVASYKKLREENKQLREELKKTTVTEAVKQNIILQLTDKVTSLTTELKRERERNNRNEEIIKLLQAQLDDLEKTIEVAEEVKTA